MTSRAFLCSLFVHVLICNGYLIQTDFEYEYYNKSIQCADGENCEIQCLHDYGCKYSTILCPNDFNCTILFNKQYSGQNTHIFAETTTNLKVSAVATHSANDIVINGPIETLAVFCGYYSCHGAVIYSPNSSEIALNCDGYRSCSNLQLFSDNVNTVDLHCTDTYACEYMKLYHQSPPLQSQLNVVCSGNYGCRNSIIKSNSHILRINCSLGAVSSSYACTNADIHYTPDSIDTNATIFCGIGGCTEMSIYAIEGIFDISVESQVSQTNLKMFCGINYYHSCDLQPSIDSNNMLCDDTDFCMRYQHNPVTDLNIVIPQSYDKYNDTIVCDTNFIHCSVYCIGKYSCAYSDIICPQNVANASCTIYCGNYGCSHSVIIAHNISTLVIHSKADYSLEYVSTEVSYLKEVTLNCDNAYSCQYMTLNVINTNEIDINCRGSYSCQYSDILYTSDGDYENGYTYLSNVNMDCYGVYSCRSNKINSNAGYLNIDCNSDSSSTDGCYDSSIYCPSTALMDASRSDINVYCNVLCAQTDSCINLDIYSINGWNNVQVSSINDQYPSSATMHCDLAFSESCSMQGHVNSQDWFCDSHEICSIYRLDLSAKHIIVTRDYEYYNKTIECELERDCYIYCGKTESCKYAVIECGNRNCSLYCYGSRSCQSSIIIASQSSTLSIYSSATEGADHATIYAPTTELFMECNGGSYSCEYATIYATNTSAIELQCLSAYSCQYQTIYADNSRALYQNCVGSYSCRNSVLFQYLPILPLELTNEVHIDCRGSYSCYQSTLKSSLPLTILCESDHSCKETNAFIPQSMSFSLECISALSCNGFDIFSLNGFINTDVNITSVLYDSYANTVKYHCGNGYTKYCELNGLINSHKWICSDTSNDCYDYEYNENDTYYLTVSDSRKYAYDYIICDENKQNCDISCKAQYSCWNSRIICPMNNGKCSVYCSQSVSCTNLNIYSLNGLSTVMLDCNANNQYCSGITIFCTQFFNETCTVNGNGDCIGFCGNYSTLVNAASLNTILPNSGYNPNNSYIISDYDYEYYNNSIECIGNLNNECRINCKNSYSCAYASISFVGTDLDCYVSCPATHSCADTTINSQNCKSLTVHSGYYAGPQYIYLYSLHTFDMHCTSTYACRGAKIYKYKEMSVVSLLQMNVICNGYYSCDSQYFSIEAANSVNIECISDSSCRNSQYYHYSLLSSNWNCGANSACYASIFKTDSDNALIRCGANSACDSSKMFVPRNAVINCSHSDACDSVSIYSIQGSNALNIVSTVNNTMSRSNMLYCTDSYAQSCTLTNDGATQWNCASDNPCYEYVSDAQVFQTQYTYQFYNEDIYCSADKDCHIACKHQYSCQYSRIHCPNNNHSCNVFCGDDSCTYATINVGNYDNLNLLSYGDYGCGNCIINAMNTTLKMRLQCTNQYSCQYMQVFGEFVNDLSMECLQSRSCRYAKIYQYSVTDTRSVISLNCLGYYSCDNMLLTTNAFDARVVCNRGQQSEYGCNSMNIFYNGLTQNGLNIVCDNIQSCINNKYYVLNGEYSMNITTFAVTDAESNKLYCCESWIHSCTLKGQIFSDELICTDRDSECAENNNNCPSKDSSNIINIIQKYEYYNNTIVCNDDAMQCNIICKAPYSCSYATIYCLADYDCHIYCIDQYSCDHSNIYAESANALNIIASGINSLEYSTINAPINQRKFELYCPNSYSCRSVQINAEYSDLNALQCHGSQSCYNMRISADYASNVDLSCIGTYSCQYLMIWNHDTTSRYFGLNCDAYRACSHTYIIGSAQSVDISCKDDQYTCYYMQFFCKSEGNCTIECETQRACDLMNLYAIEPINSLTVTRGDIEYVSNAVLHCGVVYENQCTLQSSNISNLLACDATHICRNYELNYDTTDYIIYNWPYWNYKRNITCDTTKTNCEIYCSGSNSCQYNTIKCSSNSNGFCKISSGASSCRDSTIYIEAQSFMLDSRNNYALSSANLNIAADVIDMDCSDSYACSSLNILLQSNDTLLTMNCPSMYSCQSLEFHGSNINIDASINCGGYGCRYSNMYVGNAKQFSMNCQGQYACDRVSVYASKAMTFEALECGSSTSCRSLAMYCSYPSLDTVCVMEYEPIPELWFCEGDICVYDDQCQDYNGLTLSPNVGSLLGGDTIVITGPCYNPEITYMCKFGTEAVHLQLLNATHAFCVSPPSTQSGSVLFAVHENNEWYGMISTFYYNNLYEDFDVFMDPPIDSLYNDTIVNISWDISDLRQEFVDINLYQIIPYFSENGGVLAKTRFLMNLESNIANNGTHIIHLNNTQISWLNFSTNWNIIYDDLSDILNIITVAVESFHTIKTTPIRRRKMSNFIQQFYPFDNISNITSPTRRRTLVFLPALGAWVAKAFAVNWIGCKVWKSLDEQIYGPWWRDRRLPRCPPQDPSDRISDPRCEGPWEPDDACQRGGILCKIFHTGAHNCIRSAGGQQCCYTIDGGLCSEPPCAGTVDMSPVSQGTGEHIFVDVVPFVLCRLSGNINDYYDRRPSNPNTNDDGRNDGGAGRAGEACAPAGGDPHFVTFDLFNYTFNGIGDYYYLYYENFKMIVRMQKFNNGSVMTKLGLDINTVPLLGFNRSLSAIIDTLEVGINEVSNALDVYMNGEIMLFSSDMYDMNIVIGDVSINYRVSQIIIRCSFGLFIEIWLRNIENILSFIEFTVDVDSLYEGQLRGLIGNYDNIIDNDLQSRNGTILHSSATIEEIHYNFGLSWLLTENDNNILHSAFISDIDPFLYTPLFGFDDIDTELLNMATEKCGTQFSCIYDVVATEVVGIANTTLEFVQFTKDAAETIKKVYNVTEIITPSPTLEALGCFGEESMNLYLLIDTNCNITQSQCVDQQLFIAQFLEKLRSNPNSDSNTEQLFGYIEYGNGANTVVSLRDYERTYMSDFYSMLELIKNRKSCSNLLGSVNHPYSALQSAINDFSNIDNGNNNIIVLLSVCPPSLESEHSCSLKQTLQTENIKLFVINSNSENSNSDSYACLVNDINNEMSNLDAFDNINAIEYMIDDICRWTGNPTTQPENKENSDKKLIYFIIGLGAVIVVCILCLFCHWCYIYRLKQNSRTNQRHYGSVGNDEKANHSGVSAQNKQKVTEDSFSFNPVLDFYHNRKTKAIGGDVEMETIAEGNDFDI